MNLSPDLRAAVFAALLCAALSLAIPVEFISLLFMAPLAFFLPGYAIVAATLVEKPPDRPQVVFLSLGLSLSVLAIGGIPLNYLGGLTPGSWAGLLVLVVLTSSWVAARRRRDRGAGAIPLRPLLARPSPATAALLGAALLATVAAVVLAFVPLSAKHAIGYTELWVRPYSGKGIAGVRVGVGNQEKESTGYVLRTRFGAGPGTSITRIRLAPGETAVVRIPASPAPTTRPLRAFVELFLAGEPQRPYRQVWDWLPPPPGEAR